MKVLSILLVLSGSLIITACGDNQKPKIENPFAGHVEALQKAKDLKRQVEEATDQRMQQLKDLH